MAVLFLAGVMGDAVNYGIGRHVGPAIFGRESRWIKKEYLLKAHYFYERHGGKAIVLARFVPVVRTFAPFVAGIALMHPRQFFMYNILGCAFWVGGLVSAGYFLGSLPFVRSHFNLIVYARAEREIGEYVIAEPLLVLAERVVAGALKKLTHGRLTHVFQRKLL